MQPSVHNIGRIQVQVNGASAAQSWALKQDLDAMLQDFCDHELDALLTELDMPGMHIHIPSLQIDLGKVSAAGMRDRMAHVFRETLLAYKTGMTPAGSMDAITPVPGKDTAARLQTAVQRQQELLLHYLQYGYFPWGVADAQKGALLEYLVLMPAEALASFTAVQLLQEPVLQRIIQHAGSNGFAALFDRYLQQAAQAGMAAAILHLYLSFRDQWIEGVNASLSQQQRALRLIRDLLGNYRPAEELSVEQQALVYLVQLYREAGPVLQLPVITGYTAEQLQELPELFVAGKTTIAQEIETAPPAEVSEPVIVPYLGVVLLHPFIAAFLGSLGLLDEKQRFRSEDDRMTALGALLHLCAGNTDAPEYELLFLKLLLDMPHATVLARDAWQEKKALFEEESAVLLQSVISHWVALRSTSVQGLRESFLQRSGRLHTDDEKILVKIERSGFDVLLDRLPWSYSEIHLPWLRQPIQTEW